MDKTINGLLSKFISKLNAGLAVVLVLLGPVMMLSLTTGFGGRASFGEVVFGLLIGTVIGVAWAVMICGIMAIQINIRDLLEESVSASRPESAPRETQ